MTDHSRVCSKRVLFPKLSLFLFLYHHDKIYDNQGEPKCHFFFFFCNEPLKVPKVLRVTHS